MESVGVGVGVEVRIVKAPLQIVPTMEKTIAVIWSTAKVVLSSNVDRIPTSTGTRAEVTTWHVYN